MTEYPMSFPELPYYLSVFQEVNVETETVTVLVRSKIHVDKEVRLPTQYSIGYTQDRPNELRGGVLSQIVRMYGLKQEPLRYS